MEEAATDRHEYHSGDIFRSGEPPRPTDSAFRHDRILANLARAVKPDDPDRFHPGGGAGTRLAVGNRSLSADGFITRGTPSLDTRLPTRPAVLNPRAIFEVLGAVTEAYDRGAKFAAYRTLGSLREYVLVSQHRPEVETFFLRDNGDWRISSWVGSEAVARLFSVEIDLPLAEVYAGVEFEPAADALDPPPPT